MEKFLIVSEKPWNRDMHIHLKKDTGHDFKLISNRKNFVVDEIQSFNPGVIFFPHWSYLIPPEIFLPHECIVFHMTDLPFGRGGSPLQNLIMEGCSETKISAVKVVEEIDAGPVYLKKNLSLHGAANDIFARASKIIEGMIKEIIQTKPKAVPQDGEPTFFTRRKPSQSDLASAECLDEIYDKIRMLDADGYPHAFVKIKNFTVEFTRVSKKDGKILAQASFKEAQ